jgi:excisionase family DNA binding protein
MAIRANTKGINTGASLPLVRDGQHFALASSRERHTTILPDLLGTVRSAPERGTLPFRERLGCSPSEACVALGVGRTLFYQLIAEGRVEVIKLGRRTVVCIPSLIRLLDGGGEQGAKPKSPVAGRTANGGTP